MAFDDSSNSVYSKSYSTTKLNLVVLVQYLVVLLQVELRIWLVIAGKI